MSIILFFLIALSGCMIGPDYRRPDVDKPASWRSEEKGSKDVANTAWWEQFNDPVLNELIQTSLKENKDLKIAAARIEEFIGRYGATRASLFPQIGAGATAVRQRTSEVTGPIPLEGRANPTYDTYEVFLNAGWEIDLWGRLRRATEAARADLLSTEEARRTVLLTLVTSVADAYVNLRDLDRQLEIARQTAATREDSYKIFKLRFQGGIISELELNQVKSEYESALATIPVLEKMIAQQEHSLSVLLGQNPRPIQRGKTIDELIMPAVPAGMPSDLLLQRPDIRQAEQDLIAANARIGVARAAYFPTISLTGLFGFASADLSNLFEGSARTWSYAVPVTAPIFTGGAISGQVKVAEAIQQQALFRYQQVIQTAFREVEDSLVDQKRSREQLEIQAQQVESLRNYARIARLRYENGYTSYIEVLDAERSLFNAQLSYTQTKGNLFRALVNLYKAIGGGWIVKAEQMVDLYGIPEAPPAISESMQSPSHPTESLRR